MPLVASFDHIVLTVASIEATARFYADALDVPLVSFGEGRHALKLGEAKINLHQADRTFEPKAAAPTPGSGDVCLRAANGIAAVMERLAARGIAIEVGPVMRTGALGPIRSIYVRDPDGNLVEVCEPA